MAATFSESPLVSTSAVSTKLIPASNDQPDDIIRKLLFNSRNSLPEALASGERHRAEAELGHEEAGVAESVVCQSGLSVSRSVSGLDVSRASGDSLHVDSS